MKHSYARAVRNNRLHRCLQCVVENVFTSHRSVRRHLLNAHFLRADDVGTCHVGCPMLVADKEPATGSHV